MGIVAMSINTCTLIFLASVNVTALKYDYIFRNHEPLIEAIANSLTDLENEWAGIILKYVNVALGLRTYNQLFPYWITTWFLLFGSRIISYYTCLWISKHILELQIIFLPKTSYLFFAGTFFTFGKNSETFTSKLIKWQ